MAKKFYKALCILLSIAMLTSLMTITTNAVTTTFTDVPASHWAYEAVSTCASKGIVSGMGNGTFAPDAPLTNAQFTTMVINGFYSELLDNTAGGLWYTRYMNAARKANLLSGTVIASSDASADVGMTRYDMAQVLRNALSKAGGTATDAQLNAAKASVKDWSSVPTNYQEAVSTCFALGVLSGMGDGSFSGSSTMTRAQACVVLNRLEDVMRSSESPAVPSTPVEHKPPVTGETEISVTTVTTDKGTGYVVGDNQFESGYLNNGKPITEENVLELLAKAKTIWPADTSWGNSGDSNNHWYENTDLNTQVKSFIRTIYNNDTSYACGGFAAMISDYLFGKYNNPMRRLDDVSKTRPGDIIIRLNANGRVEHIMIARAATNANGYIAICDGNNGGAVNWSGATREETVVSNGKSLVVYTRYPD